MAKEPKEPKSPNKLVFFDLKNSEHRELRKHADNMDNFSEFVRERLREDKLLKEQGPPEEPKLDPQAVEELVEALLSVKFANRGIPPIQASSQIVKIGSNEDVTGFF